MPDALNGHSMHAPDDLLMVGSASLRRAAEDLRSRKESVAALRNGVMATAAQLDTAARLVAEAEPSIITGVRGAAVGVTVGVPQERPAFIDARQQDDPDVLAFKVGILSGESYRIDREGRVLDA